MDVFSVFVVCMNALFGAVSSFPDPDGDVLYDPTAVRTFPMPESCKSKNMEFCFDKAGYPDDVIELLLKDFTNLNIAKDNDVGVFETSNRQGESTDDCRTQSTTDPIYYIVDEAGRDRVVVQMDGRFQQRYSVNWCETEGRVTSRTQHFLASTVKENNMSCENKYMQYDFVVLSLKPDFLGKWKMERARTPTGIPVCCMCRYKKVVN